MTHAHLEELPPLALTPLRELRLDRPAGAGRGAHVASASGVIRRGDLVYVIGDELPDLAVFHLSDPAPGRLVPALAPRDDAAGDVPRGKPDLEALTVLPPFPGARFGALLGLGSGSAPGRDRGFAWPLRADGRLDGDPLPLDLAPLYDRLRSRVGHLNVEGVAVMGADVWLFNRGDDPEGRNAVMRLAIDRVIAAVTGDGRLDGEDLGAVRRYELGRLDGVGLAFSDATPLGHELIVFTASAEASGGPGPDGAIRGSVVGTLAPGGEVRRLRTIDRRWKVEGLHATVDTGVIDLLFVCDQDDPDVPSPLLSAAMPLEAAFDGG
ncbi:MAG TPA: hypothetical protein VNT51_12820 [Miltoncostaeaceae bacterium]|nr:hypothetical protein [Miltoncostaeaceae bacterium]